MRLMKWGLDEYLNHKGWVYPEVTRCCPESQWLVSVSVPSTHHSESHWWLLLSLWLGFRANIVGWWVPLSSSSSLKEMVSDWGGGGWKSNAWLWCRSTFGKRGQGHCCMFEHLSMLCPSPEQQQSLEDNICAEVHVELHGRVETMMIRIVKWWRQEPERRQHRVGHHDVQRL